MKGEDQIRDEELSAYLQSTEENLKMFKVILTYSVEAENSDEAEDLVRSGDVEPVEVVVE